MKRMDASKNNTDEAVCNSMSNNGTAYKLDCKFLVGNDPDNIEIIFGCKYLFAIESPVFERMLLGDFKESQKLSKGIPLPDDDPKTVRQFRILTCCSRSDRASHMEALDLDETINLTQFCHKYMAISISKLCTDRLVTLCDAASIGGLIKLFETVLLFSVTSPIYIKVVDKLKRQNYPLQEALNDLNPYSFKKYINRYLETANYGIGSAFTAIESYLKHNGLIPKNLMDEQTKVGNNKLDEVAKPNNSQVDKMQKTFLRDILKDLDFGKMEITAFLSGPNESDILTLEQKHHILTGICKKNSSIKLFEREPE